MAARVVLGKEFWSKVDMSGPCWVWTGATVGAGFPAIRREGRLRTAHRLAFETVRGALADGERVRHDCGNRLCVRPAHMSARATTRTTPQVDPLAVVTRALREVEAEYHQEAARLREVQDQLALLRLQKAGLRRYLARIS